MGRRTFKPRYLFTFNADRSEWKAVGVSGIRADDFARILDLAGQHIMRGLPEGAQGIVTHVEEHNDEVILAIKKARASAGVYKGRVTIKFTTRTITTAELQRVFTCASLEWTTRHCPDYKMWLVTDPDVLRVFRTLEVLHFRADEPRMAWIATYSWPAKSPRKGGFEPLLAMKKKLFRERVEATRERIADNKRWSALIRNRVAAS